jgi:hypothetical protein
MIARTRPMYEAGAGLIADAERIAPRRPCQPSGDWPGADAGGGNQRGEKSAAQWQRPSGPKRFARWSSQAFGESNGPMMSRGRSGVEPGGWM